MLLLMVRKVTARLEKVKDYGLRNVVGVACHDVSKECSAVKTPGNANC
jgi:hypothetical protein